MIYQPRAVYVNADDDHCASNPCMNDAECRSISGGFSCNPCPLNVSGVRCELGTLTECDFW